MKSITKIAAIGIIVVGGAVYAKEGVQDPTVKAWQELMGVQGMSAKTLGEMAGGKTTFDAAAAEAAKAALIQTSTDIPAKFETQATDPVSEAKPEIWANWDDFVAKAGALKVAAEAMDTTTVEGVQAGMEALGGACVGCHKAYRIMTE